MPRPTLLLIGLAGLTFFAGLGRGAITDADEAFYAESAHEMVASGDWITPHYNFEPRFQKPVLYYWLTAATYRVAGESETTARWWAAMAGLGLVLLTARCGRTWYDEPTGLLAGAIAATSFGYFSIGRMALPDLPLTFFITLSIWAAFRATIDAPVPSSRAVVGAAVALGLGFLTKGPVALILPALVVVPILVIERRSLVLRPSQMILGAAILIAVAAPWYVAMWARHGTEYLQSFFIGDNLERFATDRFNDPRPWWFYGPIVAGGLLPWTPMALIWVRPVSQWLRRRADVGALDVRLLMWALLPLAFYTASVGKQPRYVLPVLPPLAVLLAASIMERTRGWRGLDGTASRPRRATSVVAGAALGGAVLIGVGLVLIRVEPLLVNVSQAATVLSATVMGVCGLLVIGVALSRAWRLAPAVLAGAAALTFVALQFGGLSSGSDDTVRQIATLVAAQRTNGEPLATYGVFVRNLVFYTGEQTTDVITDEQAQQYLSQPSRALIVATEETLDRLEHERRIVVHRTAVLPYFNPAGVRVRTLIWPDRARDLTRVVLASNQP